MYIHSIYKLPRKKRPIKVFMGLPSATAWMRIEALRVVKLIQETFIATYVELNHFSFCREIAQWNVDGGLSHDFTWFHMFSSLPIAPQVCLWEEGPRGKRLHLRIPIWDQRCRGPAEGWPWTTRHGRKERAPLQGSAMLECWKWWHYVTTFSHWFVSFEPANCGHWRSSFLESPQFEHWSVPVHGCSLQENHQETRDLMKSQLFVPSVSAYLDTHLGTTSDNLPEFGVWSYLPRNN